MINTCTGINNSKIRFGNAKFNFKEIRSRKLDISYYDDNGGYDDLSGNELSGFHCMMDDFEFSQQLRLENSIDVDELGNAFNQIKLKDKSGEQDDLQIEEKKISEIEKKILNDKRWNIIKLLFVGLLKNKRRKKCKFRKLNKGLVVHIAGYVTVYWVLSRRDPFPPGLVGDPLPEGEWIDLYNYRLRNSISTGKGDYKRKRGKRSKNKRRRKKGKNAKITGKSGV